MDSGAVARGASFVEGLYFTTSTSSRLVVLLRFLEDDADTWAVLPKMHGELLPLYARMHSYRFCGDAYVLKALVNMQFALASDPCRSDKTQPLRVPCPLSTDQFFHRSFYRCYTTITIPTHQISSLSDEINWIRSVLPRLLEGIREVLRSPPYREFVEKTVQLSYDGINHAALAYVQLLFSRHTIPNFGRFLATAGTKITPLASLSDYVVTSACNDITTFLQQHQCKTPKYK